jgi:hypothetical protein
VNPCIYVSYAWKAEEQSRLVERLEQSCRRREIDLKRDCNQIHYGDSIRAYMNELGRGGGVILVLSDAYFKSEYCMYELRELYKNSDFRKRIYPVVLKGTMLQKPIDRIPYLKHWEAERAALQQGLSEVDRTNTTKLNEALDAYADFRRLMDDLLAILADMNVLTEDVHLDTDFDALLNRLLPSPVVGDDVASTTKGLGLLKDLIAQYPAVAYAVTRSQEVIKSTSQQVSRLELFKNLHDALHEIEFGCLRPLQEGGPTQRLRPFKIAFEAQARRMADSVKSGEMNPALRDDIVDELKLAGDAFQGALDDPGDKTRAALLGELDTLIARLPPRMDAVIADAAAELNLNRLVELMTSIGDKLPASSVRRDANVMSMTASIDALKRLRDGLARLVAEHVQLQRLDSKLRTVCLGGTAQAGLAAEWNRIKLVRSRMEPPYSLPLDAALEDLEAMEAEIDQVFARGDGQQDAADLVREYFRSVSTVFRDVDTALKDFCLRLSEVNQPLAMLLDMSQSD